MTVLFVVSFFEDDFFRCNENLLGMVKSPPRFLGI